MDSRLVILTFHKLDMQVLKSGHKFQTLNVDLSGDIVVPTRPVRDLIAIGPSGSWALVTVVTSLISISRMMQSDSCSKQNLTHCDPKSGTNCT